MPTLTRVCLRSALGWLVVGFGLLLLMAADPAGPWAGLRITAFHCLTVGWITQMIFGVAHWMFPRASREAPRGQATLAWVAWATLNTGMTLRVLGDGLGRSPAPALLGGLLQLLAAIAWALHIWPRVKER